MVDVPECFLGTRGHAALSDITLRRLFDQISRVTGIRGSPRMLRHPFCTLLSKFGVPDRLAREAMGHADKKTLRRCQHVYEGEVAKAMMKLELGVDLDITREGSRRGAAAHHE